MDKSIYEKHLNEYIRLSVNGGAIIGKLTGIDMNEHALLLDEAISREMGERAPEIVLTNGIWQFKDITGVSRIDPKHYERMKLPDRRLVYLDHWIGVQADGIIHYGKLDMITLDDIELKPFLAYRNSEPYIDEGPLPHTIMASSIKSIFPRSEQDLRQMIDSKKK